MMLQDFLQKLFDQEGSDLHVVVGSVPRLRVDGQLKPLEGPALTGPQVWEMAEPLLTGTQRQRLETARECDGAFEFPNLGRFRFHLHFQQGFPAIAIRRIVSVLPSREELGLPPIVEQFISKPQGLILVTGPTGSGKSTTLAVLLDCINRARPCHIVTLEDPIEVVHPDKKSLVSQMEVGSDVSDYHMALRTILRQDPDVVFLGELRDLATIQAALTLAETGHLTLATLHTNSAIQTLTRLISVFPPHQQPEIRLQLSMVLEGVLSQRLLPRLQAKGRVLALEILAPSPAIRNLIREDKIHQMYSMMQTGQAQYGMQTMNQALADLAGQGVVDRDMALSLSPFPDELQKLLQRSGRDRPSSMSLARLRSK